MDNMSQDEFNRWWASRTKHQRKEYMESIGVKRLSVAEIAATFVVGILAVFVCAALVLLGWAALMEMWGIVS